MKLSNCAFNFYGLKLYIFLSSIFVGSTAALRTLYAEEVCYVTDSYTLNLRTEESAILISIPNRPLSCRISVQTRQGSSLVVAFNRYRLGPEDTLDFQDYQNFYWSLRGHGNYPDERKSFLFEGPLTVHYSTNNTYFPNMLKFQMVFTQVYNAPCKFDDFKCKNNKCIPRDLACDQHNHCGDSSNQVDCRPKDSSNEGIVRYVSSSNNSLLILLIVSSSLLVIIIAVIIAVFLRGCVLRRKAARQTQLPTVSAATNTNQVPQPSVIGRIRRSFRALRNPTAFQPPANTSSGTTTEIYEVPSMYPHIPSAPQLPGVDNPEFKIDE